MNPSNTPILSILVCTLPERTKVFNELMAELNNQRNRVHNDFYPSTVEIVVSDIDRGVITIGAKRNWLQKHSNGRYTMYLDDDDMIHFMTLMIEACLTNKDIITYDFNYFVDQRYLKTMIMNRFLPDGNNHCSKHWAVNYNPSHRFTISESHYHLCAIKKKIAEQIPFIDSNNAEDVDFSKYITPLIESEFHIEHTLLDVFFSTKKIQNI